MPADTGVWGEPECIYAIYVSAVEGPFEAPEAGDSVRMVENGLYWHESFDDTSCDNPFPIIYGEPLEGPPVGQGDKHRVKPKPLRTGIVYEVTTASRGDGYGGGKFLITHERKIVNLPH